MSSETGNKLPMHRLSTIIIAAAAVFIPGISLFAQEATAGLSSPASAVGRPVEMVVTVRDARSAEVPQSLDLPGLRIELIGRSTRFEMNNFKITSSLTYTYSVLPRQVGDFDIPGLEVQVGNKTIKTNPLRLSVADASAMQTPPGLPVSPSTQPPAAGGQTTQSEGLPYFGELVISKKKSYVGEVIPAEFRYYFNPSIGGEVGERPNLVGEGFTIQKLTNVPKREQIVNGQNYTVFAFQTAITPAKSGPLEIPPAKLEARLQLPGSAPAGFDDFFRQFGGIAPPGMFTNMQQVSIDTAPTPLEIIPLPKQGRPDDFSGAIGKFKMEASVSPKKAGPGDPVTLRVVVSGQGNFEAMGAPVLVGDEDWRSYPPSEKFKASDAISYSGEKVYEFMLVARSDQQQTPGVRFSYLDPDTGKYEILTQDPLPVQARAGQAASQSDTVATEQKKDNGADPSPPPLPGSKFKAGGSGSWTSIFVHPAFLLSNAALGAIWIALLVAILIRRLASSPSGLRRKKAQKLKAEIAVLESCSETEFTQRAVDYLLVALDMKSNPLGVENRLRDLHLDDDTKAVMSDLLSRGEELKYSAGGIRAMNSATRGQILSALKKIPS